MWLWALLFVLSCAVAKEHKHNLEWAVVNGTLYARCCDSRWAGLDERVDTTLYVLLGTVTTRPVADHTSHFQLGDHAHNPPFSFWRTPGDEKVYLLPEFDYLGQAEAVRTLFPSLLAAVS
jgi:hypothetical protein